METLAAFAPVATNGYGAGYETLKAGPNTINAAGVTAITRAVSDYAGICYSYQGFQNGAHINGVGPNYKGSTSYIFAGDPGDPSLVRPRRKGDWRLPCQA